MHFKTMHQETCFLILTNDTGFGHRSAANSIAKAMDYLHSGKAKTVVINPILEPPLSPILRSTEVNYDRNVNKHPDFYRFTYEISDSRSASAIVETTLSLALYRKIRHLLESHLPDAIVSTNQLFSAPVGFAMRAMDLKLPFFTVVTDLADVHSLWFNPAPDRFFVASEQVKAKAVTCGIPPEKIILSGIPVDPALADVHLDKTALRKANGLDPKLTTLLVVGSKRVNGIPDYLEALQHLKQPFQVVLIAGGDETLFDRVTRQKWNFPIHIEKYVENMSNWLLIADILVTKAGGLILSEGLAAGLPIILINHLPGQEEGNVEFVLTHQAGVKAYSPFELLKVLNSWLGNERSLLSQFADNSRRAGHADSALVIAESAWQAAQQDKPAFD